MTAHSEKISFGGHAPVQGPGAAELEAAHRERFQSFAEQLAACVTVRLTGTRDAGELYEQHIRDCLESVPLLPPGPRRAIDVGSGGGLPGLVWAICRPDLEVVLLDSVGKKVRAVQAIAEALGLSNVKALCARSEDIARAGASPEREGFDVACARAVASAGITAELLSPLVKVGGFLLTFKGAKLAEELAEVEAASPWGRLGLRAPLVLPYGGEDSSRTLVLWEKSAHCPLTYPRPAGMAAS
ncbi:MAG: 16S rRNA (guanine(527)-N(7))-methyltransferase RsmG, partial [Fretibacterium sp.]|nr:16S rRNA (guanine(527)-N(7))-methyltransferase RsmG [Fretibacterium sp.]